MAQFAFATPMAFGYIVILYATLIAAWIWLWRTFKNDTNPDGRKRYSGFWRWWLGNENPSVYGCIMNWMALIMFFYNMFRLACTIIYGYKGE